MTTQTRCRAKDPSTCTYHGGGRVLSADKEFYVQQMEQAQLEMNFEAYGQAFAAFKGIEDDEAALPARGRQTGQLFDDALALAMREKPASVQERALLYARVPNESEGEVLLSFFRKRKHNTRAIMRSQNPYMYRVVAGALQTYQPTAEVAETIATSGDHRARLLLASNMPVHENVVKGNVTNVLNSLAGDNDPEIRAYVAKTEGVMRRAPLVQQLASDPHRGVRLNLAENPALTREAADLLRHDNDGEISALGTAKVLEIDARQREYEAREAKRIRDHEAARANGTLPWYEDEDYYGPGSGYDEHGVYHPEDDDS